MYFREFGIPARIARCYNVDQLRRQSNKSLTVRRIVTLVYIVFDDTRDRTEGKTNYDSASYKYYMV